MRWEKWVLLGAFMVFFSGQGFAAEELSGDHIDPVSESESLLMVKLLKDWYGSGYEKGLTLNQENYGIFTWGVKLILAVILNSSFRSAPSCTCSGHSISVTLRSLSGASLMALIRALFEKPITIRSFLFVPVDSLSVQMSASGRLMSARLNMNQMV